MGQHSKLLSNSAMIRRVDATGTLGLLGDVRHDPFQSGADLATQLTKESNQVLYTGPTKVLT